MGIPAENTDTLDAPRHLVTGLVEKVEVAERRLETLEAKNAALREENAAIAWKTSGTRWRTSFCAMRSRG